MRIMHPSAGSVRYKKKFLLLPVRIGNETRWLERAVIRQTYRPEWNGIGYTYAWVNKEFVEEEEK